ncbi:MAG TPA: hypothetical protein VNS55_12775 [Nocardioides sp.]|nr:hypothetical protein [Nocardioides sp.]
MAQFLQECFLTADAASLAAFSRTRVEAAAAEASTGGAAVRLERAIFVPVEETLFLLWHADDADAVRDAAQRAGLDATRITPALEVGAPV